MFQVCGRSRTSFLDPLPTARNAMIRISLLSWIVLPTSIEHGVPIASNEGLKSIIHHFLCPNLWVCQVNFPALTFGASLRMGRFSLHSAWWWPSIMALLSRVWQSLNVIFCRMCTSNAVRYFRAPWVTIVTSSQPVVNPLPWVPLWKSRSRLIGVRVCLVAQFFFQLGI